MQVSNPNELQKESFC